MQLNLWYERIFKPKAEILQRSSLYNNYRPNAVMAMLHANIITCLSAISLFRAYIFMKNKTVWGAPWPGQGQRVKVKVTDTHWSMLMSYRRATPKDLWIPNVEKGTTCGVECYYMLFCWMFQTCTNIKCMSLRLNAPVDTPPSILELSYSKTSLKNYPAN